MQFDTLTHRLPKGLDLRVRRLRPDDKDLLKEGLAQLGEEGSFYRFHRIVREFTDAELVYLTEIDHVNHVAWGAGTVTGDSDEIEPVGVARYVRLEDEPSVAEAAVTVLDRYRRQGVGTFLLQMLSLSAARHGIDRFMGSVLSENRGMLVVFERLGATVRVDGVEATVDLPLPLPGLPGAVEDLFGRF